MRILYLSDIRFPIERANGIQTMETAHALARRGHIVHLGVRPDIVRPPQDPFAFYGLAADERLRIERAPIAGPYGLRRFEFLAWAGWRTARARDVDVVFTRDLGVADLLRRVPGRPPLVYESHGFAPVFAETLDELVSGAARARAGKVRRLIRRERRVWRDADGYVTTTAVLADELASRFGPRPRVEVVPNGLRFSPDAAPPAVAAGGRVVLYAGQLYPWKGVDVLLRALATLPDVAAVILGGREGDADWGRIAALSDRLGIRSRVTLAGFVPKAALPARLADASLFVLPTLDTPSARYTCPLKMFEYMACGRPIVASDLPPVREVLTHDVNASLVPPGEPAALAAAIARLLDDPERGRRLAARARADSARYTWDRRGARVEAVLTDAVARRKSRSTRPSH